MPTAAFSHTAPAKRIVVLFGGLSSERRVSFASAQNISDVLPEAEFWYWSPEGPCFVLTPDEVGGHTNPFSVDFPLHGRTPLAVSVEQAVRLADEGGAALVVALHGGAGENGEFAALCESLGVPFTGSGSVAQRLAFDKVASKGVAEKLGVRVLPSLVLRAGADSAVLLDWYERHSALIAKPVQDGSSIGLRFLRSREDLDRFCTDFHAVDYLIEPLTIGIESTVGVLDTDAPRGLEPVEIRPATGNDFDFQSKYLDPTTREICPSTFSRALKAELEAAAVDMHRAVGAEGYSRSDFIVTQDGPVFLEINTHPGLTRHSLYPRELLAEGIEMRDFLLGQVDRARKRASR